MRDPRFDTARWAERRRPFDRMERRLVRAHLASGADPAVEAQVQQLRYALSFARLTEVRTSDGTDVDVSGILHLHSQHIRELIEPTLVKRAETLDQVLPVTAEAVRRTRLARESVLEHLPIDRDSLEAEVTTRLLAVASGGGGGAGYVYPGCYEMLERNNLIPDLMVGTSIGALMSMFRCRRRRYDAAPLVAAARTLSWSNVFRVLQTENRYGLPATLRLYLHACIGNLFLDNSGTALTLGAMEIPLYVVTTGITVDALKHDLDYYEHLLDGEVGERGIQGSVRGGLKTISILREFLSRPDSLKEVILGRIPGTENFDTLDAAGFSAAIPGVIHYDVLRDDPSMHRILDNLYAEYGITRLGEGGMVANVPARVAWESVVAGTWTRRNVFVLSLDCFAPNPRKLAWFPFQQLVQSANVYAHRQFTDLYLPLTRSLSPMNLVPPLRDALMAMRWGREAIRPHMPFVKAMMAPIPVLPDEAPPPVP